MERLRYLEFVRQSTGVEKAMEKNNSRNLCKGLL